MIKAGGIETILNTIDIHINNEEICENCCYMLGNIFSSGNST